MAIKLNLGSGNSKIDGFISVDLYDDTADVRADICQLPFDNDSVDEIVAYQVVEHVPYNKSQAMFDEMYRVLKVMGTAKIETPDIDVVCKKILEEGLEDKWIYNLVGEYYRPWDKERYDDWEHNAASIHRNPWNYGRLVTIATKSGFTGFTKYTSKLYPYEENMAVCLSKYQ